MNSKKISHRDYNPLDPLISLHVPKCAGQSFIKSLEMACSSVYSLKYFYPDIGVNLPEDWYSPNTIIHGHFVRWKGHSVEEVCIGASQFITIVRDPFDICVSAYFYGLRDGHEWATSMSLESFLEWWLAQEIGPLMGALPYFAEARTIEDYCEQFVCIGEVSQINKFYDHLSIILGTVLPKDIIVNTSIYTEKIPDMRCHFQKRHRLDYELFNFIKSTGY